MDASFVFSLKLKSHHQSFSFCFCKPYPLPFPSPPSFHSHSSRPRCTSSKLAVARKVSKRIRCEFDGKVNGAFFPDSDSRLLDRQKALEAAMNDINNSFGKGSVTRLGSAGGALVKWSRGRGLTVLKCIQDSTSLNILL